MLVNFLCAKSLVDFIRRLDTVTQKLAREIQEAALEDSDGVGDSAESPSVLSSSSLLPPRDQASYGGIRLGCGRIRGGKASSAGMRSRTVGGFG